MPLPAPKRRGRPPGSKNRSTNDAFGNAGEALVSAAKAPLESATRPLPEDPGELDKALAPYRIYSRMPVKAISSLCEILETSPLDKDESTAGIDAGAMCFYQYGAQMNCWFALGMFFLGIGAPRVIEYAAKQKQKKEGKTLSVVKPQESLGIGGS